MMLELAYILLLIVAVICFTAFQIISLHLTKVNAEIKSMKTIIVEHERIDAKILDRLTTKEKKDDAQRNEDSRNKGEQAPTEAQGTQDSVTEDSCDGAKVERLRIRD